MKRKNLIKIYEDRLISSWECQDTWKIYYRLKRLPARELTVVMLAVRKAYKAHGSAAAVKVIKDMTEQPLSDCLNQLNAMRGTRKWYHTDGSLTGVIHP